MWHNLYLGKEETSVEQNSLSSKNNIKESNVIESTTLNKKESPNINEKSFRRLRLKRQSNETLADSNSIVQEGIWILIFLLLF